jgi:transposase
VTVCKEQGWLKARGRQRTDSTHVLAKVRALHRAECVVETVRHAQSALSCCRAGLAEKPGAARLVGALWKPCRGISFAFWSRETKASFTSSRTRWVEPDFHPSNRIPPAIGCSPSRQLIRLPRVWKQDSLPPERGGSWKADEDRLEAAKRYFSPYDLDASAAKKRGALLDW